jgi:putative phosphoesterase
VRIAIISDIHGNIYAFEKVVKDLRKEMIEHIIFLGDLVFLGLYPQECYDLLVTLNAKYSIKGNTDSNIEELKDFTPRNDFEKYLYKIIEYTDNKINNNCRKEIRKWNISERAELLGSEIIFCHGSPYSFKDQLSENTEDFKDLKEKIVNEKVDTIFSGHTHKCENFKIGDTDIINFGPIGYSFNGDVFAHYGIVEIEKRITYHFKSVDYYIENYKKDIRKQKPLFMDNLLYSLENGVPQKY